MFFTGYLLLSDIDGTLFIKEPKRYIPRRNLQALEYFMKKGGKFAVATGRSIRSALSAIGNLPMNCPAVLYNGGGIYDYQTNRMLWQACLEESAAVHIPTVLERFPEIGVEIHVGLDLYCIHPSKESEKHVLEERSSFEVTPFEWVPKTGWNKILFAGPPDRVDRLEANLKGKNGPDHHFVRSEKNYFEIIPAGADKGTAMERLANLCGITLDKTCAIGDYYNDIPLLQHAAFSSAVEESPEAVKQAAGFVAGPCHKGAVADFIEHLTKLVNGGFLPSRNI